MKVLARVARSNHWPRLLVGLLVGFYLWHTCQGPSHNSSLAQVQLTASALATMAKPAKPKDNTDRVVLLARTDQIELLKWALANYDDKVLDYTATLQKQERIKGKLKHAEIIDVRFKQEPFSVMMSWRKNAGSIDKLLYVEGSNDDKMIVHPTGLLSWIKSVERDPQCKAARKSSRRTCDQFGFYRTMESLLDVYQVAQAAGDLKTSYMGLKEQDERKVVILERVLPPKKDYPYARLVMEFDVEYLVPTRISCYDWRDTLLSTYAYEKVLFNVGLKSAQFEPHANGL